MNTWIYVISLSDLAASSEFEIRRTIKLPNVSEGRLHTLKNSHFDLCLFMDWDVIYVLNPEQGTKVKKKFPDEVTAINIREDKIYVAHDWNVMIYSKAWKKEKEFFKLKEDKYVVKGIEFTQKHTYLVCNDKVF